MKTLRFDNLTKSLAEKLSRRRMLGRATAVTSGVAASLLGSSLAFGDGADAAEVNAGKKNKTCGATKKCPAPGNPCREAFCKRSKKKQKNGQFKKTCAERNKAEGTACGANGTCSNGVCGGGVPGGCPTGQVTCAGICVDLNQDENNCGRCGKVCGSSRVCDGGDCVALGVREIEVTPANPKGWVEVDQTTGSPPRDNGTIDFVTGPGTPPLGSGSLAIETLTGNERAAFVQPSFAGLAISNLDQLGYSTYVRQGSSSGQVAPAIKMSVTNVPNTGNFTTLIFEPVYFQPGGTVVLDSWQTWDALDAKARWWSSRDVPDANNPGEFLLCNPNGANAGSPQCANKQFVPWNTILAALPNATVQTDIRIETGGGTANARGNVDGFLINDRIFNFEP